MLPLRSFLKFIKKNNLFSPNDPVLLAVSGGRDSVLLAHLFNEAKFTFGIAHCNFGLRDEESDNDATFTQSMARQFGVPFFEKRFDTNEYAKAHSISVQMAARELRYSWFEDLRQKKGYKYIALAHHLSDTTETMLLNLTRGTGISGLHGILPKRGSLLRPLLFLNRAQIEEIVVGENIAYREDSSNQSSKYARNKIRLEVIPKLKEINPQLDDTFEQNSRRFLELEEFLNQQVELIKTELFTHLPSGNISIELERLKALHPLRLLLFELFKNYGFSEPVLNDLVKSWDGQPGKSFESTSHQLFIDRKVLLLVKKEAEKEESILLNKDEAALRIEEFTLIYQQYPAEKINITSTGCKAFFDAELLQFPLKLRQWKKGDYFFPFGMEGKKKLSDFFVNIKIPLADKKKIKILENGNGEILWIVGYRTDNRYKITSQTKKVYIFEKHKPR